jgi:hypothetical protein
MSTDLTVLISTSLRTLLKESLFRAEPHGGYLLNGGEPGLVETLRALSAQTASRAPGPNRKPIVAHANHMLFALELMNRAVHGDEQAFAGADWKVAWQLVSVDEAQWSELLGRLEKTAREVLEAAPKIQDWNEIMFTGVFSIAAHTAYHLGAIRQLLRDNCGP